MGENTSNDDDCPLAPHQMEEVNWRVKETLLSSAQDRRVYSNRDKTTKIGDLLNHYTFETQDFTLPKTALTHKIDLSKVAEHFSGRNYPLILVGVDSNGTQGNRFEIAMDPTRYHLHDDSSWPITKDRISVSSRDDGRTVHMSVHPEIWPNVNVNWSQFSPKAYETFIQGVWDESLHPLGLSIRFDSIDSSSALKPTLTVSEAFGTWKARSDQRVIKAAKRGNGFTSRFNEPVGYGKATLRIGPHSFTTSEPVRVGMDLQVKPGSLLDSFSGEELEMSAGRVVRSVLG